MLDNAVRLLGSPSADYKKVLNDAMSALPGDAEDKTRVDIRSFLSRAPEPGTDFRCSVEFLRRRARKALLEVRSALLNASPRPAEPEVCHAVPSALDMTRALAAGRVDIYGYDLDTVMLQMLVVTVNGFRDVTAALRTQSHNHLILDLANGAVPLSPESLSLDLVWGHLIHHSIPLVQETTRLCSSRIETIVSGRRVAYSPSIDGRGDFSGEVSADVTLDYSSNKLEATICVITADPAISGCTVEFLYTTDADSVIEALFSSAGSQATVTRANWSMEMRKRGGRGPVGQWVFSGPRAPSPGSDAAFVVAQLDAIRLVSTKDESCVSPITYLEARRSTVFGPRTRKALDRQLKRIDSKILKLRPQFAPAR